MGMDIYGLNPKLIGIEPKYPDNYDKLSDKAKEYYWELNKEFNDNNPGRYFRANIWSWRPIHMACLAAITLHKLNFDEDLNDWGFNDGGGLKTQKNCNELAVALEDLIDGFKFAEVEFFGYNMSEAWTIKLSNGYEVTDNEKILNVLNMMYPKDTLITQMPKLKDTTYYPSHVTEVDHLEEFTVFLRNCGGFKIL